MTINDAQQMTTNDSAPRQMTMNDGPALRGKLRQMTIE
jgi:hypothetical protein